jgi:hypothetical protein
MPYVDEGAFRYRFPDSWIAVKFDESTFYSNHFQDFAGGTKAVDVVAYEPDSRTLWLIEAKDYRQHQREKKLSVGRELAEKARGTLACLMAGRANAGETGNLNTDSLWGSAVLLLKIRFIFHLEQPTTHSRLFPQSIDPKIVKDILARSIRAVDQHPVGGGYSEINRRTDLGWRIESVTI